MQRTTVMLPRDLKLKATETARAKGISLGEMIRESLERALREVAEDSRARDPLFADAQLFEGETPEDLAQRHDDYLYGEA